jgi:hypothetical protein
MNSLLDRATEAGSRWLARRSTRRSFLGTTGKAVLVAAGGSTMSLVFANEAEARVCGQSGVSPRCPTFDCVPPDFWGWCWYAGNASCCADGGLKKICDCCRTNYPNVQGYCPDGSTVFCVVESCLEDPRVQRVELDRWIATTPWELSIERTRFRLAPGAAPTVVMTSADDPFLGAISAPVAAQLGVPLLLTPAAGVPAALSTELARLGTTRVVLVGGGIADAAVAALRSGRTVDRLADTAPGIAAVSVEIGKWLISLTSRAECLVIGAGSFSAAIAPSVGGLGAVRRIPVVVSADAASALSTALGSAVTPTWIGPEAGGPGPVISDPAVAAQALAQVALDAEPAAQFRVAVIQVGHGVMGRAVSSPGTLTLLSAGPDIDPALRDWIVARAARFSSGEISLAPTAALHAQGTYRLQSALNGFNAHLLQGVSGQGIPVVAQPMEERPRGKARVRPPWPGQQPSSANGGGKGQGAQAGATTTTPSTTAPSPSTTAPASAPAPAMAPPVVSRIKQRR